MGWLLITEGLLGRADVTGALAPRISGDSEQKRRNRAGDIESSQGAVGSPQPIERRQTGFYLKAFLLGENKPASNGIL